MRGFCILVLLIVSITIVYCQPQSHPTTPPPTVFHPTTPPPTGFSQAALCKRAGFSARKAVVGNPQNQINAPSPIKFQDTLSIFGPNNYHIWDNTEYCPFAPGYYFFSFHAMSTADGDFTLALVKNGEYQVTAYGNAKHQGSGSLNLQSAGNSAIIELASGDCVWLQLQYGSIYENPEKFAYTTFTGYMVQPKTDCAV